MEKTLEFKVLGPERIKEIFAQNGLTEEDQAVVAKILEKWQNLLGRNEEKARVAIELMASNPRRKKILMAIYLISSEFCARMIRKRG